MNIRSLGEHRRKRGSAPEAEASEPTPIGTFSAKRTRDANALARDGQQVYAMNDVQTPGSSCPVIEIQFADGEWLLIDYDELSSLTN